MGTGNLELQRVSHQVLVYNPEGSCNAWKGQEDARGRQPCLRARLHLSPSVSTRSRHHASIRSSSVAPGGSAFHCWQKNALRCSVSANTTPGREVAQHCVPCGFSRSCSLQGWVKLFPDGDFLSPRAGFSFTHPGSAEQTGMNK